MKGRKTITITFDEETSILVEVSSNDDGTPCATPGQLLGIFVKVLAVLTILSSQQLKDAYATACHISSLVAEAIRDALSSQYAVSIRLNDGQDVDSLN